MLLGITTTDARAIFATNAPRTEALAVELEAAGLLARAFGFGFRLWLGLLDDEDLGWLFVFSCSLNGFM